MTLGRLPSAMLLWILGAALAPAEPAVRVLADQPYRSDVATAADRADLCRLDLYVPEGRQSFPALVWFHGGGLTGGSKHTAVGRKFAQRLAESGVAVAMADYRLHPGARFPAYVEDAAAAFAWVHGRIAAQGGDPRRVFIGGHSAGAYLALMVAMDATYLSAQRLDDRAIAGVVAISAQTSTHFTVRVERALGERLVVDDAAPLYHARTLPYPVLLYTAEDDLALRTSENRLLAETLREAKSRQVVERVWPDRDHGTVFSRMSEPQDPVAEAVVAFLGLPDGTTTR